MRDVALHADEADDLAIGIAERRDRHRGVV